MSITYAILNIDEFPQLVDTLKPAVLEEFSLQGSRDVGADGHEADFVKTTSGVETPMTVRVGHYPKIQPEFLGTPFAWRANCSVRVNTYVTAVDSVSGITYTDVGNVVIAFSMPTRSGIPDKTDLAILLQNAATWLLGMTTGGDDFSLLPLDSLAHGLVSEVAG
jgi:hypothetical protein